MAGSGIGQFELSRDEAVLLTSMQAFMMSRDIRATKKPQFAAVKQRDFNSLVSEAVSFITNSPGVVADPTWDAARFTGTGWAGRFAASLKGTPEAGRTKSFADAAPALAQNLGDRSRALLLVIELVAFYPWVTMADGKRMKWESSAREQSLRDLVQKMPALVESDLAHVLKSFRDAQKRLARKNTNWMKIALFAGAGVAVGAMGMWFAAPVIAGVIGGAMGLSGAAAVSAGMALLGGGSLAAGGMGMAGGTAILVGTGAVFGAGGAALGAKHLGLTAGQMVAETMKLEVLTKIVIVEEQGQDEVARLVVLALEERLGEVEQALGELIRRRDRETADSQAREDLEEEVKQLKLVISQLELTIGQLRNGRSA